MARLGLWGPGSAFSSFQHFLEAFSNRGVGALELVGLLLSSWVS